MLTLFCFGSRVDDEKRGGDIDLFVKTKKYFSLKGKLTILTQLERKGITRKVDLLIQNPSTKDQEISRMQ